MTTIPVVSNNAQKKADLNAIKMSLTELPLSINDQLSSPINTRPRCDLNFDTEVFAAYSETSYKRIKSIAEQFSTSTIVKRQFISHYQN